MHQTTIRMRAQDCVAATCGPAMLMFWKGADRDGSSIRAVHALSVEPGKDYPKGIAHVNLVEHGGGVTGGISEGTRTGLLGLLRDAEVPQVAVAVVMAGGGFLSALIRSVLSGAALLARSSAVIRFVGSTREADAFLRSPAGRGDVLAMESGEIVRAVATVQNQLERLARI